MLKEAQKAVALATYQSLDFSMETDKILIKVLHNLMVRSPNNEIELITGLIESTIKGYEARKKLMEIVLEHKAKVENA